MSYSTPPRTPALPPAGLCVLGAIAGDIIGSVYENRPTKDKNFTPLFDERAKATDDTVLTVATMEALLRPKTSSSSSGGGGGDGGSPVLRYDYASAYREFGRRHPRAGYGKSFEAWLRARKEKKEEDDDGDDDNNDVVPGPYGSWGNGSAMRVSPIGWAFDDRRTVLEEARRSAVVTHDHPEGIKGAQATALAVYLARTGSSKEEIRMDVEMTFGYDLTSRTVDEIRPTYRFEVSCQKSVPEAILCFLESMSVEDAARLAVSLGGDADTQACIACGIAEAYYGPLDSGLVDEVWMRLARGKRDLLHVVDDFGREVGDKHKT